MKKKWEYLKVEITQHFDETIHSTSFWPDEEKLNKLGHQGWELVCTLPELSGEGPYLLFKRPLEE